MRTVLWEAHITRADGETRTAQQSIWLVGGMGDEKAAKSHRQGEKVAVAQGRRRTNRTGVYAVKDRHGQKAEAEIHNTHEARSAAGRRAPGRHRHG